MYSTMIHICIYTAYIAYIQHIHIYIYLYIYTCAWQLLQSCLTFWDPMDCSPPGSSVYGIFQAKLVEWVAMPSSRASFWPRDWICISCVSCVAGGFFTRWVIGEALIHTHTHTHTHTGFYIFFSITDYYKIPSIVSYVIQWDLAGYLFSV